MLVDIVPNHVGIGAPEHNAWWWDVLLRGRASDSAEAFDIDWDAGGGRVRLPILGDEPSIGMVDDVLVVDGVRLPVADGSVAAAIGADGTLDIEALLEHQHYELMHWRRADAELNYRRFFGVNSLAGIRVEIPWVFERSHAEIVRWVRDGLVDGLRIDHPDGLLDPGGYLDDLAAATDSCFVLVEKILEGDEQLPPHWRTAGTTGYDALGDLDRVLIDAAGLGALDRIDAPADWTELIHGTRLAIAEGMLRAEVLRIERLLIGPTEAPGGDVATAIAELAASMPVYRTYLPHGAEHLLAAERAVRSRRPNLDATLDGIMPRLLDATDPAAQRMQQTTGMIMAKGVEDTAFYRYDRLASLNEVGGDPSEFSIDLDEFHARLQRRQAAHPTSQTTLTTHDTKRGEDVRARIDVLSEVPREWSAVLADLCAEGGTGSPSLDRLLWESVIGAWPASRERLQAYALKAAREGGVATTWADPDDRGESAVAAMIDRAFDDPRITAVIDGFVAQIAQPGWSNALSAKVIQLMAPGVPDVYQGSELWQTSLVDPDNRRPVDFAERGRMLAQLDAGLLPEVDESGAAKLLVTSRLLRLRRDRPELFTRIDRLTVVGPAAEHAIAFDRGGAICIATRHPVSLASTGWGGTSVILPSGPLVDVITGESVDGGEVALEHLLRRYPVAVLIAAD